MPKKHWLVKQEPEAYPWDAFVAEGGTAWTGVRNFQARNYLREMRAGDWVIYYHSGKEKAAAGLALVKRTAYPDPTAGEGGWVAVDLAPRKPLRSPVTLEQMKADGVLKETPLIRQTRLSVSPLSTAQFARLLELAQTKA
jgi:predicted RNA-binding protein with PUA-like domain